MKIYTKKGDKGETSLFGGTRVPKHHLRIEAYGTLDELNSWLGVVADHLPDGHAKKIWIHRIQDKIFSLGSQMAADPSKTKLKTPDITSNDITFLESTIDEMDEALPELRSFILPGGHPAASFCHVARTVCRRAERLATQLSEQETVEEIALQYLNRLSDWLFILSRWLVYESGGKEIVWKPEE